MPTAVSDRLAAIDRDFTAGIDRWRASIIDASDKCDYVLALSHVNSLQEHLVSCHLRMKSVIREITPNRFKALAPRIDARIAKMETDFQTLRDALGKDQDVSDDFMSLLAEALSE